MRSIFVTLALSLVTQSSFATTTASMALPGFPGYHASISCTDGEVIDQIKNSYASFSEQYDQTHEGRNRMKVVFFVKINESGLIDISIGPVAKIGMEQINEPHIYIQPSRGCFVITNR